MEVEDNSDFGHVPGMGVQQEDNLIGSKGPVTQHHVPAHQVCIRFCNTALCPTSPGLYKGPVIQHHVKAHQVCIEPVIQHHVPAHQVCIRSCNTASCPGSPGLYNVL